MVLVLSMALSGEFAGKYAACCWAVVQFDFGGNEQWFAVSGAVLVEPVVQLTISELRCGRWAGYVAQQWFIMTICCGIQEVRRESCVGAEAWGCGWVDTSM